MRSEVEQLSASMRQEMRVLASQVEHARDKLTSQQQAYDNSRKLASSRDWLLLMPNGRYCCGVCTTHCSLLTHIKQRESPFILSNGGVRYTYNFSSAVNEHGQSKMHAQSGEHEQDRMRKPLEFSLHVQLLESREITLKLFRTVLDNALHYRSFLDYENLVTFLLLFLLWRNHMISFGYS
jgi:hypothetical protein